MLEFSPEADTLNTWVRTEGLKLDLYHNNPDDGIDDPDRQWEDYIAETTEGNEGWEVGQFETTTGFHMPALLLNDIKPRSYALVCYGPTLQGSVGDLLKFAALRANWVDSWWNSDIDNFSPIRVDWQSAAQSYQITSFEPHDAACDEDRVCPPCN